MEAVTDIELQFKQERVAEENVIPPGDEKTVQRYMVRHKYLNDEELEYQQAVLEEIK